MTFAEVLLLIVGGVGTYYLLAPLQRWLERYLVRKVSGGPRLHRTAIDVTPFTSRSAHTEEEEEDDEHRA